MKFMGLGDLHLRATSPIRRIDDVPQVQYEKMKYVLNYALDNGISHIGAPGDLFDKAIMPDWVKERYIRLFNEQQPTWSYPRIWAVLGQHDMRYHTNGSINTPIGVLAAGCPSVSILKEPVLIGKNVFLYGASWGEDIPEPLPYKYMRDLNPKLDMYVKAVGEGKIESCGSEPVRHVLLIHKMITHDPLWEAQEDYERANHFLRKHQFDLVVSGDNHNHFTASYRGRHLVNCGSLLRSTASQTEHEPCFYVWDSETREIERHVVPHKPSEDVFDLRELNKKKEERISLDSFIEGLKHEYGAQLDFKSNLQKTIDTNKELPQEVVDLILLLMEE